MSSEIALAIALLAVSSQAGGSTSTLRRDPSSEKPRGVLEIEVIESGSPASGFLVEAERDGPLFQAVTDGRGLAVFHEVRPGTWKLRASDPEGNRLEVFVDTKWHVPQPCAEPLDLMKSDDEIMALVDRQIAKLSGVSLRADWERERTAQF